MAKQKKKQGKAGQFGTKPKQGKIQQPKSGTFNPGSPGTITQINPPAPVGTVQPGPLPAPATAAPPSPPQELPGWEADPAYQQAVAGQLKTGLQTNAQYITDLSGLGASSGLYENFRWDDKGTPDDPSDDVALFDPTDQAKVEQTNPFSRAALLRRSWRQAQTGGVNSYAAAGQLYSGALKNAVGVEGSDLTNLYNDQQGGYNSFNYQSGLGGLKTSFNESKSGLDQWRLGVGNDAAGRVGDAASGAVGRWIEQRPEIPPPPRTPPDGYGVPGNKGQPHTFERVPRRRAGRMVLKPPPRRVRGPGRIRQIG